MRFSVARWTATLTGLAAGRVRVPGPDAWTSTASPSRSRGRTRGSGKNAVPCKRIAVG